MIVLCHILPKIVCYVRPVSSLYLLSTVKLHWSNGRACYLLEVKLAVSFIGLHNVNLVTYYFSLSY